MCGPSSALKAVNQNIQNFATTVQSEAGTVFGAANSVFNKITGALSGIIAGGPGQNGWSASQNAARTAATVQAGAAEARNLKGAAASSVAAIGGGNTVAPAGSTQQIVQNADIQAASDTAAGLNQNQIANAQAGQQEFNSAISAEEQAPSAFNASTAANQGVNSANQSAFQSQSQMDTQSNWAMNDVMKLGSSAVQGLTTGFGAGMCPAEGSQIKMADTTGKGIETVRVGEHILGVDGDALLVEKITAELQPILLVTTEKGLRLRNSFTHCFITPDGFTLAIQALGKSIITAEGEDKVTSVEYAGNAMVYSIETSGSHTYQADSAWAFGVGDEASDFAVERFLNKLAMAKGA
jgi:hypothetical protein